MNNFDDKNTKFSKLSKTIDHAVLHPAATKDDFSAGCDTALAYDTATFCVPSFMVESIARRLAGSSVKACATVGFPHGNAHPAVKLHEAVRAMEDGAAEIDMTVNIGLVKAKAWEEIKKEIAEINEAVIARRGLLKVIFETCYLDDAEIIRLSKIAVEARAAFVKTSTGFGTAGADAHHVSLMRRNVPDTVGVKASGGIRTLADVKCLIAAGATRIGTSSTAAILAQAADEPS
jgi:deoxyribose-phosphate aldolase